MALTVSETLSVGRAPRRRQIWSIGGGKGGIGKSLIAASLGWQLARMGQKVDRGAEPSGSPPPTAVGTPEPGEAGRGSRDRASTRQVAPVAAVSASQSR